MVQYKKTTMNMIDEATFVGSYSRLLNSGIEVDYEFILILKKPGKPTGIFNEIMGRLVLTEKKWGDTSGLLVFRK